MIVWFPQAGPGACVRRMRLPAALRPWVLVLSILGTVADGASFDLDAAPGRLPKTVLPLDYRITITPDVASRTFEGQETVSLQFRRATDTVVFNSVKLQLRDVRLDGRPVARVVSDEESQLTTVTLSSPASVGVHSLTLSYQGEIGASPQGLFAQTYSTAEGGLGVLLSTQLEPADARRVFPCWDEPAFRATYQLTTVLPSPWVAVSNMPVASQAVRGGLVTTAFERSPRMPSYLVQLTAGDLRSVSGEVDGVRLGVWAVRGQQSAGYVALSNARQILQDYNDYFGFKYPLPKLDSIAIPGGFSGAMENWGAITYTAQTLLIGPSTSFAERQSVFSMQAHEMAHQWNGDLVALGWWDDLWLNESLASWRAAAETELRNPEWKWWESQDGEKEIAMSADAHASSEPIQRPVRDELQANSAFDPAITYNKGQSVLRMLESYLGPQRFQEGIRAYIRARAFGNATRTDLWDALSAASGQDVGAIAAGWTGQPGFPLVSVRARCDDRGARTLSLTQKRFLVQGSEPPSIPLRWKIPLQVRSGTAAPQPVLFTQDGQRLRAGLCTEPLSLNAGAVGYYRVSYDEATLAMTTRAFGGLPDADRIALLDDQWALVDTGRAPLWTYLALVKGLSGQLNVRAWEQVTESLDRIVQAKRGTPGYETFVTYARSLLKPTANQLKAPVAGESQAVSQLRRSLMMDLGIWGDPDVLAEARRRFAAFEEDTSAIGPDDQQMILYIVASHADAAMFERLHQLARRTKSEVVQVRIYDAMAQIRDPRLAEQVVQIVTGTELPAQALLLRLNMLVALQQAHPMLAWPAFSSRAETLLSSYGSLTPLLMAEYVPGSFWNSLPPNELEAWLKAHLPAQMEGNIRKGMETVRFKLLEKTTLIQAADTFLASLTQAQAEGTN